MMYLQNFYSSMIQHLRFILKNHLIIKKKHFIFKNKCDIVIMLKFEQEGKRK